MKMLIHNTTSLYRPNILSFRFYKPHTDFTLAFVYIIPSVSRGLRQRNGKMGK